MNLNSSTQSPYVNSSGNPPTQLKSQWGIENTGH